MRTIKITLCSNGGDGKTAYLERLNAIRIIETDDDTDSEIEVCYLEELKFFLKYNDKLQFIITETNDYHNIPDSDGIIVVFSLVDEQTWNNAQTIIEKIHNKYIDIPIFLLGTHADLKDCKLPNLNSIKDKIIGYSDTEHRLDYPMLSIAYYKIKKLQKWLN